MTIVAICLPLKRLLLAPLGLFLFLLAGFVADAQANEPALERLLALRAEARAYEHGEGVTRDPARAIELYCEGARLGDVEAQFSLGWLYANGRGVARADDLASFFFSLAAERGHDHAQRMLRFVGSPTSEAPECFRPRKPPPDLTAQPAPESEQLSPPQPPEFVAVTAAQKKAVELVQRLAPEYGISPRLALAVIRAESNFDPSARSPKNAQGLMQLIPETALRFNVTMPFDPAQNVRGGLAYLRWLLAYFRGNVTLAAAAYNAGEGTVNRYRGMPPFPETRAYVSRILQWFGKTEHPYDERVTTPSPVLYSP
jgi:TPR repeat protein